MCEASKAVPKNVGCTKECWMGKTLYLAFVEQTFLVKKVRKFRLLSLFDE